MGVFTDLKHRLLGKPIHSKFASHERLVVPIALAVFASDALSSVAYASEEIMHQLKSQGPGAMWYLVPISGALILLLWTVIFSYYQTINAYPKGGGSYRVSSENLGQAFGLVAGAALLIGYVLTVAVSVSAGASAIIAMAPGTHQYAVLMACSAVVAITVVNLRGAKESGAVFAPPTYSFIALIALVIAIGVYQAATGTAPTVAPVVESLRPLAGVALLMFVVKAFAAGCTALTGTEAIADGVLAFKAPEARNASKTIVAMGCVMSVLFGGISWAAYYYGVTPMQFTDENYRPVIAQIAAAMVGEGWLFYATQVVTAMILMLAANTGFADFPRLSMFIARDGFMPRQLTGLGDRLVYQNGIILLAVLSIVLIFAMRADTHALLPMYAIGVFLSFTLSQAGMVRWWKKQGRTSWKKYVSLFGAVVCGLVVVVQLTTRWFDGAWITIAAIAVVIYMFVRVKRHYGYLADKLNLRPDDEAATYTTTVLLLVPRLHRGMPKPISVA
ncbi:MAG: APC family permease, partial [Armatimonadetes bacterium]|nr:APC family permease [Armatimonadota bacterium]